MQETHNRLDASLGRGAALTAAAATLVFAASLLLGLVDASNLWQTAGYAACIVLAVGIVAMMAAVYGGTPPESRILGLLALLAAVLYAPYCIATYYLQLAVVASNPLGHSEDALKLVAFIPGSPLFALDMLGYAFLCLSTLCAAFTLTDPRDKALRILCIVHGALAVPTLAAPIMSGSFVSSDNQANDVGSLVLLVWCALFTPIALLFSRRFRRDAVARRWTPEEAVNPHGAKG